MTDKKPSAEPIQDEALDAVTGGKTSGFTAPGDVAGFVSPGDVAGIKRTVPGDGSVKGTAQGSSGNSI